MTHQGFLEGMSLDNALDVNVQYEMHLERQRLLL